VIGADPCETFSAIKAIVTSTIEGKNPTHATCFQDGI
jgi:hypothetical protein